MPEPRHYKLAAARVSERKKKRSRRSNLRARRSNQRRAGAQRSERIQGPRTPGLNKRQRRLKAIKDALVVPHVRGEVRKTLWTQLTGMPTLEQAGVRDVPLDDHFDLFWAHLKDKMTKATRWLSKRMRR